MSWWNRLDGDRFIEFRQKALAQRPDLCNVGSSSPAAHTITSKVWFPFTMILDDYAAFLTITTEYLESGQDGAPIEGYTLGSTVLMWHSAIWEYIGQSMNMFCDWFEEERKVSFERATDAKRMRKVCPDRIAPIPHALIKELAAALRSIRGTTSVAKEIRNMGSHRYHLASTYSGEYGGLIQAGSSPTHCERLRGLQENVIRSFDALIKAQNELKTFLQDPYVRKWHPYWFLVDHFVAGDK